MNPTIEIDGKSVIFSDTLLLRDGQRASILVPLNPAVNLKVELLLLPSPEGAAPEEKRSGRWYPEEGTVKIELVGWEDALGAALNEPQHVGQITGKDLWFHVASTRIAETNRVTLVMLLGAE
jgi:hypothetical protein